MREMALNVEQFVTHPGLLGESKLSVAQIAILKSVYGLSLTPEQLEVYLRSTGRTNYPGREEREITLIAGRRAGKTSKIAAPIIIFEAFRHDGLPAGEEGYAMILAPTIKQARIPFRVILKHLRRSPILSKRIVRVAKEEITLDNSTVIGCYPCTYDGVRGRTIIAVIADEFAFWPYDENSADPSEEVIAALLPGMANVRNPKLIKISTPFGKQGSLWDEYRRRSELDYLVFQISSPEMNPTLDPVVLERERLRDEEKYRREFEAEFTEAISLR